MPSRHSLLPRQVAPGRAVRPRERVCDVLGADGQMPLLPRARAALGAGADGLVQCIVRKSACGGRSRAGQVAKARSYTEIVVVARAQCYGLVVVVKAKGIEFLFEKWKCCKKGVGKRGNGMFRQIVQVCVRAITLATADSPTNPNAQTPLQLSRTIDIFIGGRSDLNEDRHYKGKIAGLTVSSSALSLTEVACIFGADEGLLPGLPTCDAMVAELMMGGNVRLIDQSRYPSRLS